MPPKRKGKAKDKVDKLFVHDGTTERLVDNARVCFLASIPDDESGTPQHLVTGAKSRISFRAGDPYRAHIEISIIAPKSTDRDIFYTSYLRLDALCLAKNDLASMDIDDYKKICHEEGRLDEDAHCYQLVLEFDGKKLCTENIFTDHCPDYATDLRDYLRANSKIAVYLSGLATIATNWEQLVARFTEDRKNNPMLAHYPSTMSRPVIQKGMYLAPEDRPVTEVVAPVYAHFDWLDYMTRNGYGAIYEHEHIKDVRDPFESAEHEMFFFELPGGDDRRVMFFLRASDVESEVRLRPNDKVKVFFDRMREEPKAWSATITEALPYSPQACVTGFITRPWDKETMQYKDDRKLRAIPAKQLGEPMKAMTKIMRQRPHQVYLKIIDSDDEFSRCISSLEYLNRAFSNIVNASPRQKEELRYLIGNNFDQAAKVDIYKSVAAKQPKLEDLMALNEGQAQAVATARHVRGGYLLIHGGPGTGKTYLIGEMCKPFFVDGERHRILICSANNTGVDNAAARTHHVLKQLQKEGRAPANKYVIRLHSYDTETDIMENDAKKARPIPVGSRPKCVQDFDKEELAILDRLDLAKIILEEYQRSRATRYEGINDKRVVEFHLSLGYRMLQVAGIVLDEGGKRFPWAADVNNDVIQKFVENYREYKLGQEMERDVIMSFRKQTKTLANMTINGADIIACTLATASTSQIALAYKPVEGIFEDEAARIPEPTNWPIIEKYEEAEWKVLIGDHDQLAPVVQSNELTNPFVKQMRLSQMHRLTKAGAMTVFLSEQARAIPEIAEAYSHVIYQGRLTHAPSTALEERPIAQAMRAFNKERFSINGNIVYIDLTDSQSERLGTGSVYNDKSCSLVLNLAEEILNKDIAGNDICILVPYQAQYRCYASGLARMSKVYPEASALIDNDKVDRRQGSEFSTVIVDLTRSEGAGFLREKARLNVLFSRAQNALYVVGSKTCIDGLKRERGMFLKKFQNEFIRFCVQMPAPSLCNWYSPGQVDVTGAVDEELEPSDDEDDASDKADSIDESPLGTSVRKFTPQPFENEEDRSLIQNFLMSTEHCNKTPGTRPYHVDDMEQFMEDLMPRFLNHDETYAKASRPTEQTVTEITTWLSQAPTFYDVPKLTRKSLFAKPIQDTPRPANYYDYEDIVRDVDLIPSHDALADVAAKFKKVKKVKKAGNTHHTWGNTPVGQNDNADNPQDGWGNTPVDQNDNASNTQDTWGNTPVDQNANAGNTGTAKWDDNAGNTGATGWDDNAGNEQGDLNGDADVATTGVAGGW